MKVLPPTLGHRPKREGVNSCTPCLTLKQEIRCHDLCCRHFLVHLAQEDMDDGLELQPPFVDVLRRAPTGECASYDLETGRCGAWETRPLPCRVYDCRDDARSPPLRPAVNAARVAFMPQRSPLESCPGCGLTLQVMAGLTGACDGLAPCIHCGEGFRFSFRYAEAAFDFAWAGPLRPRERLRNQVQVLLRGERWGEAVEAIARWRQTLESKEVADHLRAVALVGLGRRAEARVLLARARPTVVEAWLDGVWLELSCGQVAAAQAVLQAMPAMPAFLAVREALLRGRVAEAEGDLAQTARWYVEALAGSRELGLRNDDLKQYVQRLRATSPATAALVDRAALDRARRRRPAQDS